MPESTNDDYRSVANRAVAPKLSWREGAEYPSGP